MSVRQAARMKAIPFSGIRKVFEEVARLQKEGRDIVNLCIGRPDFDTPAHIKEAAKLALDRGQVHYTSNYGTDELRQAIAEKLRRDNSLPVEVSQVIVTAGANDAVFLAMMGTLDPGDEVLIPNPAWLHYFYCAQLAAAVPVSIPLREENGFVVDPADVEARITAKTRMLVINSPHNPTGAVIGQDVLAGLAEIAEKRDLLILSDEIYEKLIYDGATHYSIGSLPGMAARTITVNGFSKAYSMTGWRLGYVAGPPELVSAMVRVHQYTVTCATSFAQAGGCVALTASQECVEQMKAEFDRRRQLLISGIQRTPRLSCSRPKGAFYAFVNIDDLEMSSAEAADFLLKKAGVAVVPGSAFGEYGEGFVRVAYSNSFANIEKALSRIQEAVRPLHGGNRPPVSTG